MWSAMSRAEQHANLLRFYEELNEATEGRHAELLAEPTTTWYLRLVAALLEADDPEAARRIPPVLDGLARPRWSVMIPTYQCAHTLRETLESVLIQDPGPERMQIEVVDDGSGDDPSKVVEELARGRVGFFRHPKNVGHVRNFNTCVQRARGDLVHILHGDDRVEPGFYARMEAAFASEPAVGAAFCIAGFMDEEGERYAASTPPQEETGLLEDALVRLASETPVYTPGVVVRRDVYEALGGFDPRFRACGEDLEMWVRIASAYPIWFENEPLAMYRRPLGKSGKGITSRSLRSGANVRDVRRAFAMYSAYLPADRVPAVRARFRTRCADWALGHAQRLLRAGALRSAYAQSREALTTEPSWRVLARIIRMVAREGSRRGRSAARTAVGTRTAPAREAR
jgi:glycosyltransferase involved in cell wall biosynthesis